MDGKLRNMTAIYLQHENKILLLYRQGGTVVNEVWTGSAGGHFEANELNDAKACILREMKEELGLSPEDVDEMMLRYICLRNTKGEIRQNYYFFANLRAEAVREMQSNEGISRWFLLDEISSLEMPFTAKYVLEHYYKEGYATTDLYVGVANKENVMFYKLPEC